MSTTSIHTVVVAVLLLAVAPACANASSAIYAYSEQAESGRATAGASVEVSTRQPGAPSTSQPAAAPVSASPSLEGEAATETISTEAPGAVGRLHGTTCETLDVPPCLVSETAPRPAVNGAARPAISPSVVAARVAARISLAAGRVEVSPKAEGLTGAASWFWLTPAPSTRTVSVSLDAEHVTVSANPASVYWSFGDDPG